MTRAELTVAIQRDPDNDTLRGAAADWFDENGDPARGELVRVQVELAAIDRRYDHTLRRMASAEDDDRAWVLVRRQRELLTAHADKWCPVPCRVANAYTGPAEAAKLGDPLVEFRRGFLEVMTCDWPTFLATQAAIRAAEPLREVRLPRLPEVRFGLIRERQVPHKHLGPTGFEIVVRWDVFCEEMITETFGVSVTISAEDIFLGRGAAIAEDHRRRVEYLRTPRAFLYEKFKGLEFHAADDWDEVTTYINSPHRRFRNRRTGEVVNEPPEYPIADFRPLFLNSPGGTL